MLPCVVMRLTNSTMMIAAANAAAVAHFPRSFSVCRSTMRPAACLGRYDLEDTEASRFWPAPNDALQRSINRDVTRVVIFFCAGTNQYSAITEYLAVLAVATLM